MTLRKPDKTPPAYEVDTGDQRTTLLPMLVAGLVLIVVGAIIVMMFV